MKRLMWLLTFCAISCLPSLGAWTRVRTAAFYCGNSASTCTITVTAPTAGNLLAIAAMYNGSSIRIASASGIGNWTHPTGCSAYVTGYQAIDWAYNLSATSGTSVTLNFSGTAQYVDLWYFEYSGTAPHTFDACATSSNPSSSTTHPPAGSLTTTGSNDLAIAAVKADKTITSTVSPAPPWTTPAALRSGGEGLTDALGFTAITTQATFTTNSAAYSAGSTIAFSTQDAMAQIANDMTGSNEGHPHGVPSTYDFYSGPVVTNGNSPGSNTAMVYWGDVYIDANGNPATNTRVNVRNCRAYWKSASTGVWTAYPSSGPGDNGFDASDYPEDFQGSDVAADIRSESDGSQSYKPASGKTTHFYGPYPRIPITNTDMGGIVSVCEARLILDNSTGTDDRSIAKYLVNVGGDYYQQTTGAGVYNNPGIAGGKFKYVQNNWRSFAMTTLTEAQLKSNPPPIDLTGDLP